MLGAPMESDGGPAAVVPLPPLMAIMAPAAPPAARAARITHLVLLLCEPLSGDAPVWVTETDGRSVCALSFGSVGRAGVPGIGSAAPVRETGTASVNGGGEGKGAKRSISGASPGPDAFAGPNALSGRSGGAANKAVKVTARRGRRRFMQPLFGSEPQAARSRARHLVSLGPRTASKTKPAGSEPP